MRKTWMSRAPWAALMMMLLGCQEPADTRLVEMARESTARQAEQNQQMAQLQQHVAEGAKRLVEADAQARQELLQAQRELQADQAEVGRQRDALEGERREIARDRYWDSLLGAAIPTGAGLLACLLPLLLCFWLLHTVREKHAADAELADLLVEELVGDRPLLFPPPQNVPCLQYQASEPPETPADQAGIPESK